jgi:hypothetical protein
MGRNLGKTGLLRRSEMGGLRWRREDLDALLPPSGATIDERKRAYEKEHPGAYWLPLYAADVLLDYLIRLMDRAKTRPLSPLEGFLYLQLLTQFEAAIRFETGYGRDPLEPLDDRDTAMIEEEEMREGETDGP